MLKYNQHKRLARPQRHFKEEFELKPGDINSNLSNEQIATEVKALNIARDRVNKFIRRFKAKAKRYKNRELEIGEWYTG